MKKIILAIITPLVMFAMTSVSHSAAIITPIDLNDFFADPEVTVAGDGSSADFVESSFVANVLLSNDPGLGDPEVIIASAGALLKFDYTFTEGNGNDDEFAVLVLDDFGLSAGAAFELVFSDSSSGSATFDLSTLVGIPFLGLQFSLDSFDSLLDSTASVSNLRIETPMDMTSVSVPAIGHIFVIGLFWLLRRRRDSRTL